MAREARHFVDEAPRPLRGLGGRALGLGLRPDAGRDELATRLVMPKKVA